MTTSFSRSIRTLDSDKFRPSLWIISLAVAVLFLWIAWFFLSRVTILETSTQIMIFEDGSIEAAYPAENARRIRVGQFGWLRLDESDMEQIRVIVRQRKPVQDQNTVIELFVLDESFYEQQLEKDASGRIQIEVERISPATLLLRSTGQFSGAPRVSVSPQR